MFDFWFFVAYCDAPEDILLTEAWGYWVGETWQRRRAWGIRDAEGEQGEQGEQVGWVRWALEKREEDKALVDSGQMTKEEFIANAL